MSTFLFVRRFYPHQLNIIQTLNLHNYVSKQSNPSRQCRPRPRHPQHPRRPRNRQLLSSNFRKLERQIQRRTQRKNRMAPRRCLLSRPSRYHQKLRQKRHKIICRRPTPNQKMDRQQWQRQIHNRNCPTKFQLSNANP